MNSFDQNRRNGRRQSDHEPNPVHIHQQINITLDAGCVTSEGQLSIHIDHGSDPKITRQSTSSAAPEQEAEKPMFANGAG